MSKSFFFGLVTVYDWEWLWGRTAAQIELRTIDQPIVVYKRDENKAKPGEAGYQTMSAAEGRDLVKNFKKRKILGKLKKVKKYDMGTLLETGEKKEIP
jgi:hypothetical protein